MIFSITNWRGIKALVTGVDRSVVVKDTKNGNWTIAKTGDTITLKKGGDVRVFTVDYFLNCKFPAIEAEIGETL